MLVSTVLLEGGQCKVLVNYASVICLLAFIVISLIAFIAGQAFDARRLRKELQQLEEKLNQEASHESHER